MAQGEKALKAELAKNLRLFFFDETEVEEVIAVIDSFDRRVRRKVLALSVFFSNVSATGVPKALKHMRAAAALLPLKDMERWLVHAFDLLDSKGLEPAVSFMSKSDPASLEAFMTPAGLALAQALPRLQTYLTGISGLDLRIRADPVSYTDGETVCLPQSISLFAETEKNFLVYKLAASHKWAQIACGTLSPPIRREAERGMSEVEALFKGFFKKERALALDIYNVLEAARLEDSLKSRLPGLMRQAEEVKKRVLQERPGLTSLNEKTAFVEGLYQCYLRDNGHGGENGAARVAHKEMLSYRKGACPSVEILVRLCEAAETLEGDYRGVEPVVFLGVIRPDKVSERLRAGEREKAEKLRGLLDRLLKLPESELKVAKRPGGAPPRERPVDPERRYLLVKGIIVEVDQKTEEALTESGELPGVLVKGSDLGAGARHIELEQMFEEEEAAGEEAGIRYDEWDYRRGGFRKGWCTLFEIDVHPGAEPFVYLTLRKYAGHVNVLRKKFELLKTEPRLLKRQKEGEDVDLDAMVEAVSDQKAGLQPREDLFTRLDRHERSVAALLLMDVSGSTKGWINQAEKEALVLMSEALNALGDLYAIYCFSGMTRNRCEFYRVKEFGEPYSEEVKWRIAGIEPRDYTRMGPPIRHSTSLLKSVEARTKLLITLSDGKPEDYDAYKGEYGIEDTRHALVEARQQGVHPFCITIDREASSYLPHMYGEVNYTFIDDVRKLPAKITDIYLRLTR